MYSQVDATYMTEMASNPQMTYGVKLESPGMWQTVIKILDNSSLNQFN